VEETVGHTGSQAPVPPVKEGDGSIFLSLPSFRDGERCAETIKSIFENAKNPDKIMVGLIEEAAPEDKYCLEQYCANQGIQFIQRQTIRADMTKVIATEAMEDCPRINQIRLLSKYNIAAKGPTDARALTRKIVGNEEFCLQIDSHTAFTQDWDVVAKEEWHATGNEFAVLSTAPAKMSEQQDYESWTGSKSKEVPRQCFPKILDNNIPDFFSPADGKAVSLEKPLLSHAWNPAFSFSKCHIEESAPYDPFTPYVMGAEAFPRFARFWTRGYDVYTPTRNIVFHDYGPNPSGHDMNEWFKQRRGSLRQESLDRIKAFLHIRGPVDTSETALANMGIYGLGKRRSLSQLYKFTGIDMNTMKVDKENIQCANLEWVPYDSSISPTENLYQDADDLDPQPEFPLRTELTFYKEIDQPVVGLQIEIGQDPILVEKTAFHHESTDANDLPVFTIFTLWMFGLVVWCVIFVHQGGTVQKPKRRKKKVGSSSDTFKDV
jgi:hypothetical protein